MQATLENVKVPERRRRRMTVETLEQRLVAATRKSLGSKVEQIHKKNHSRIVRGSRTLSYVNATKDSLRLDVPVHVQDEDDIAAVVDLIASVQAREEARDQAKAEHAEAKKHEVAAGPKPKPQPQPKPKRRPRKTTAVA
jgi:hypothetical protein